MNNSALKRLLTNGGRFKPDHPDYRRANLLNILSILYIAIAVVFAGLNFIYGHYFETAAESAAALLCLATLAAFHKTDRLTLCSWLVIVNLFCLMAVVFADTGHIHYIFAWICVTPPVAYFLLGGRKGLVVSLIVIVYQTLFMVLSYQTWAPAAFTVTSVVNIVGAFITLVLLISFFELSRQETASIAQQKNGELEKTNLALAESKEQLSLILNSTAEAIFGVDMEMRCTFCNTSCLEMLGLKDESEMLGKDINDLIYAKGNDGSPKPRSESNIMRTCMEGIAMHADDEVFWRPSGTSFNVEYNSYPQYKNAELVGAVVTFIDNTLKKMHEEQIEYYSSHDALTGLLNRNYFEAMLNKMDIKSNLPISIIMGDLNGLKLTNDVFGHDAGDELLIRTAETLHKVCRLEDMIARLGGDEFIILLPKTQNQDALMVMSRIKDVLSRERVSAIRCSMSLGCDTKTSMLQSIDLTLKNAENEMYKEKALTRNTINGDMINALIMSLYAKNPREEQHSSNVSELCKMIGEAVGLPDTEVALLRSAGFLHDIGKIGVNSEIINKQSPLTEEEKMEYRQHPVIGFRILNLFDTTLNLAEAVYCHHEYWDGSGFPRGLTGSEIPLIARIISVAERYDTLLHRSGENVGREEALEELKREAGTRLDPDIVSTFVSLIEKENKR